MDDMRTETWNNLESEIVDPGLLDSALAWALLDDDDHSTAAIPLIRLDQPGESCL